MTLALLFRLAPYIAAALAVIVIIGSVWAWHHGAVRQAHDRGVAESDARWTRQLDQAHAEAVRLRDQLSTAQNAISQNIGSQHAQEVRRVGAVADDLRLRGPGAAACSRPVDRPAVAVAASQPQPAPAEPHDAGPPVPADNRAAVPWDWLVNRSEEHDTILAEARAWRAWNEQQRQANEAMRSAGGQP